MHAYLAIKWKKIRCVSMDDENEIRIMNYEIDMS